MQQLKDIKEKILSVIGGGEVLLIVPPFGTFDNISFGTHILQVLAEENGYKTDILYLNIILASIIGVERYEKINDSPEYWMLGERLFARSAYGLPPLGKHPEWCADEAMSIRGNKNHTKMFFDSHYQFDLDKYLKTEEMCMSFIGRVTAILSYLDYKIIGCTSSMLRQTNCSIALLSRVKKHSPQKITIIGGSSCKSEMAEGIASLSEDIDYIFSGESETTFINFLQDYSIGELPLQRIIAGEPLNNLDTLPLPNYEIFSTQYTHFLGEDTPKKMRIWYETSRGCWRGEKEKCMFCSITGQYRQKSIHKTLDDLEKIKYMFPGETVFATDSIIPSSYFNDLLPALSNKEDYPPLTYSLRADLDLQDLVLLKNAKVHGILLGIENFSTPLLNLMKKGNNAGQNILSLRNARSLDIYVDWYLLWGFPGDSFTDYKEILRILPLIRHLQPPRLFLHVILLRFSSYFENQQDYKISCLSPWNVYNMVYPDWSDKDKLAYYYVGEYPCAAYENSEIIREIANEVASWQKKWRNTKLFMSRFMDTYVIYDNRDIQVEEKTHIVDYQQAREIMRTCVYIKSKAQEWALQKKLAVVVDSWYVPLITTKPELLLEFEKGT
jgi:ribosomal peptide maturation radical SAM protein 1